MTFESFAQFWPYYVAMHSRRPTRWLHLVGTLSGAALSVAGIVTARWLLIPALPVFGYGAAWPAHWFIERNNPAAFGHPLWSFRGDMRMIATMLRGRDAELSGIAHRWFDTHSSSSAISDDLVARSSS
ncbi:MAG: hypothetical protein QOI95_97 [Acidimicrobiaceae bacterium]|jgi:hypothetical protein